MHCAPKFNKINGVQVSIPWIHSSSYRGGFRNASH